MSNEVPSVTSQADGYELNDGRRIGIVCQRTTLRYWLVGLSMVAVLFGVASVASATNLYWYGENNSTCWQIGFPGNPAQKCETVGAGYLPSHLLNGALAADVALVNEGVSGDYCNYYHLNEGLDTTNENEQGRFTGFNPPTPYGSYQEGNHYDPPDVCQADGTTWGQVVRGNSSNSKCEGSYAPCGMQHFVSLGAQGTKDQPWSLNQSSLVVSGEEGEQVLEAPNSWGYLCPLLKSPSGAIIEYCLEQWHVGSGSFPAYKHFDEAGPCNFGGGQVFTGFASGTKFAELVSGSSETFEVKGNPTKRTMTARITLGDLEAAVAAIEKHACGSQSHSFREYALVGIEQGIEGGGLTMMGGSTAHLQAWTEYTPLPPARRPVAAVRNPSTGDQNVYYVAANGQIYDWLDNGSSWKNSALGNGAAAAPGTGLTDVEYGGEQNLYYVGANGQIYNWFYDGSVWSMNAALGNGEAAAPNTSMAVDRSPTTGTQNMFYVGANGQIYDWFYNGSSWSNGPLGSGEAAAAGTGLADVEYSSGGVVKQNLYYVGANGQVYNWFFDGSSWSMNAALGSGEGEAAAPNTELSVVRNPSTGEQNVYYVGANEQIYNWFYSGVSWTNGALDSGLGHGEAAAPGTGLASVRNLNTGEQNVYYVAANGQVYNWFYNGVSAWSMNAALGSGEAAIAGSGLADVQYAGTGEEQNVYYVGLNSQIYNWFDNGAAWSGGAL